MATMGSTRLSLLALSLAATPMLAQKAPFAPSAVQALKAQEGARVAKAAEHLLAARQVLGLDGQHGFRLGASHTDEFGMAHGHFQQLFNGLRVFGGDVITHQDVDGSFAPHTADLKTGIAINTTPSLTEGEALSAAHRALAPKGEYAVKPSVELLIFPVTTTRIVAPRGGRFADREVDATMARQEVVRYHLAYLVHAELENELDGIKQSNFIVDANTGAILKTWSDLHTGAAVGTGNSQFSGVVSINTNSTSTGYEMRDMTRGTGGTFGNNVVTNANHATTSSTATGSIYTNTSNTWGDGANYVEGSSTTAANGQTAAVDAMFGMMTSWDFYKNVLGRNGIDGTGKATYSRVHIGNGYDNAFWSDSCFCMTYGDGTSFLTLTAMDVAGHEMSHGVIANTVPGGLTYSGESGGLNESNSDIFGTMIEFYDLGGGQASASTTVPSTGGNWTIGEQLETSSFPTPLRYMYKPSKDGSSKDAWSSTLGSLDVHYSSGPGNRAFYFLSQGASSSSTSDFYSSYTPAGFAGVGNDHAARIHYRATTTYYTSSETYAQARAAHISAAKDLYGAGSAEEQAVWNSFAAINVGSAWSGGGTGDTTAPTVSATESGTSGTITFSATASDNVGVTKVEFYVDGVLKGTDTASPYSMTLDSTTLSNASHTLTAKAYDAAGNVGTSSSVAFTVSNTTGGTQAEVESNNTMSTANVVATSGTNVVGYISSSTDTDYFKVTVPAGHTLAATLTVPSASDFDLYIYNSAGTQKASSLNGTGATDSCSTANTGTTAAVYYVRVKYYAGASTVNPYNLKLTF